MSEQKITKSKLRETPAFSSIHPSSLFSFRVFRVFRSFLFPLSLFLFVPFSHAEGPPWWTNRNVLVLGALTNDYAFVNMGQLKCMAANAQAEMNQELAGGAGAVLDAALAGWLPDGTNYTLVNVGQLKYLASLFYNRLIADHRLATYPWPDTPSYNDYAPANIGQVKHIFGFELHDSDHDGLHDRWEIQYFGNLAQGPYDDPDNDLLSNLAESRQGTNPEDPDTDNDGMSDGWEVDNGFKPLVYDANIGQFTNQALAVNVTIAGGSDDSWEIWLNGQPAVSNGIGSTATGTVYILYGTRAEFTLHWVDAGQSDSTDQYALSFQLPENPTSPIPWIEVGGNSSLEGALARPIDTGNIKWEYVVPELADIKITSGGAGNTDTGPGNSPLNRALVGTNVSVSLLALMTPEQPVPPDYRGAEGVRWTVLGSRAADNDSDLDGISDNVDTLATNYSDAFSDVPLGGKTQGIITNRGDRTFQIFDAQGTNLGVRIIVGIGSQPAVIQTIGSFPLITNTVPADINADFILTTGSAQIQLFDGSLEIIAQGLETTVFVALTGPSVISFDLVGTQTLQVTSSTASESPITVSVDGGAPVTLTRGESLPIAFTSDIDGDGVLDGADACPNSDMRPTVVIGGYDSKVPNKVLSSGCTIMDRIAQLAAEAKNHGQFESSVALMANELRKQGIITNKESDALKKTAAKSDIGKK